MYKSNHMSSYSPNIIDLVKFVLCKLRVIFVRHGDGFEGLVDYAANQKAPEVISQDSWWLCSLHSLLWSTGFNMNSI